MKLKQLVRKVIKESVIPDIIQRLIDHMIENKIQRKSFSIPDENMFNKFYTDAKPAIDQKLIFIKQNPINKKEITVSLGPEAYKKIKF